MGSFSAATIPTLIIGWLIGAVIGALLILLGSRLVMGKFATFLTAFLAALASSIAGFFAGFVAGAAIAALAPALLPQVGLIGAVAGFALTGPVYAAIIRTSDGTQPNLLQAYLIYIIQIAIILAVAFAIVTVFHVPIPGMPTLGGQTA